MNRMMRRNMAVLLVTAILLITPTMALADGGAENGYVATANGYQVELVFKEPAKAGENEFHIQIVDSMGMPVSNAEVEVSAMPVEGMSAHDENSEMEMATEAPSVGVMTSNSSGMDMATEVPSTGVMKPNEPATDEHGEEALTIMLEPTMESGEYAGEMHFETSGEWMFNVHFTIDGETTEVDFPIEIARTLGLNYAVLAGFFGINGTVIATAAFLKRKSLVIRK
jgi:hypothetical protein